MNIALVSCLRWLQRGCFTVKNTDKLLPIGIIAKSFGVNESTIRRMESAGLLTPAYTAEKSNYRYYDSENIAQISTILTLKSFGFVNDDIRDYFTNLRNYSELYNKLVQKQIALDLLAEKMKRKVKMSERSGFEVLDFMEMYCVTKQVRMIPTLEGISEFSKQFIFEAIKNEYPIDYTRAIFIMTECTDYRNYQRICEQELLFHIPLKRNVEKENVLHLPSRTVFSIVWNHPMGDFETFIPLLDYLFSLHKARQNGPMYASYDYGTYMGSNIDPDDTVMHICIPFELN